MTTDSNNQKSTLSIIIWVIIILVVVALLIAMLIFFLRARNAPKTHFSSEIKVESAPQASPVMARVPPGTTNPSISPLVNPMSFSL